MNTNPNSGAGGLQLKRFSILLFVLLSIRPLSGQVVGAVETVDGQPIAAVSVQAWGQARLLAEEGTDNAGQFQLDAPRSDIRRLRFAHLGYRTVILPIDEAESEPLRVILEPLPVPLPELEIVVTRSVCDEDEDPAARALWEASAARYSSKTGYRGGAVRFLTSRGQVEPEMVGQVPPSNRLREGFHEWVGATDEPTPGRYLLLEKEIEEEGYVQHANRFSVRKSQNWAYPEFEGKYAYHFATTLFGQLHTFHLVSGGGSGTEVAFCPVNDRPPSIQGRLFLAPDTTLLKAQWLFKTKDPDEEAGGEVVFGTTPDPVGDVHLVSALGIFWRKEISGPRYEGVPQPFFQIVRKGISWAISPDDSIPDLPGES